MESLFGSWLLNNGVSVVIIILIFALWLSWRSRIKAIGELATHSDALAELPSKVHAVRESVTYLSDKKMDSEKAYKEFVKHDHLNVISEKPSRHWKRYGASCQT